MRLKRNMCKLDQALRTGIGVLCVYFGFIDTSVINDLVIATIVGIFGVVNLYSAFMAHCPVYHLAGINTISSSEES